MREYDPAGQVFANGWHEATVPVLSQHLSVARLQKELLPQATKLGEA